jgi:N6-L-threonylcarbamoyladenine synthase
MKILAIETSCDETAISLVEANGGLDRPVFDVLGNALYSQVKIHSQYGGVFPMLAKREHAKNLVPLLKKALSDSSLMEKGNSEIKSKDTIKKILEREQGLYESLTEFLPTIEKPDIDLIAVTAGPGLEPALWVGINFALALGEVWDIPVIPVNHMKGHIFSPILVAGTKIEFPALALLISGGHTELVLANDIRTFEVIGETRDDAVGEAFDKVARLLTLTYPGGPEVSKLAAKARSQNIASPFILPRPMIKSDDLDFSFSGIKTAVLYGLKKIKDMTPNIQAGVAREFEDAVTEVLIAKTKKALEMHEIRTVIVGGGVIANTHIRESLARLINEYGNTQLLIPEIDMATDNAIMIAAAAYIDYVSGEKPSRLIEAKGNLSISTRV